MMLNTIMIFVTSFAWEVAIFCTSVLVFANDTSFIASLFPAVYIGSACRADFCLERHDWEAASTARLQGQVGVGELLGHLVSALPGGSARLGGAI